MSYNQKVSIILPTYNEKENIGLLIDEITELLDKTNYEIVVVDDNSPDGTWKVVEDRKKNNNRIHLLRRIDKKGLTSALNDGINYAQGDIVVWMDSDFQMPPSVVMDLIDKVKNGYDVAIGSRFVHGGRDERDKKSSNSKKIVSIQRFLSLLICRLTSRVFKTNHSDWTSGFIALKKEIFRGRYLLGDYGEYFMYLVHHLIKLRYRVVEVPYVLMPRQRGTSKTSQSYAGMIFKGIKYIYAVVRLRLFDDLYYNKFRKNMKYHWHD